MSQMEKLHDRRIILPVILITAIALLGGWGFKTYVPMGLSNSQSLPEDESASIETSEPVSLSDVQSVRAVTIESDCP